MEMVGYFLTPEFSPDHDQHYSASINRESSKKRLMGYAKSAFWIIVSIMLSLALGQLN
jgi:hypothetical protein